MKKKIAEPASETQPATNNQPKLAAGSYSTSSSDKASSKHNITTEPTSKDSLRQPYKLANTTKEK